jgi:hypothetical protein
VCSPSSRFGSNGEVHAAKVPVSTLHWNVADGVSGEVKEIDGAFVGWAGAPVTAVSAATVSTAPVSQPSPSGRPLSRWSVAGHVPPPRSIAGLSGSGW